MIKKKAVRYLLLLVSLVPLAAAVFTSRPFPKMIFPLTGPEIYQINERRSYYQFPLLAKLAENKAGHFFYKYQRNLFQGLDPNFYFFANHPRERAGILEKEKFSWFFLIPFLAGLYWQFKQKFFWGFGYFFLVLGTISVFQDIDRFVIYLFPFVFLSIILGIWKIFKCIS